MVSSDGFDGFVMGFNKESICSSKNYLLRFQKFLKRTFQTIAQKENMLREIPAEQGSKDEKNLIAYE